jgi:hypothetical protein
MNNLSAEGDINAKTKLPKNNAEHVGHHNYPLLASIPKCMQCGAPHPTKETHFWPSPYSMSAAAGPSFLLCFLCGGKTTNDQLPPPGPSSDPYAPSDRNNMPCIFQIPLLTTSETTYWSLPAQICPPVCWFLLDGSCTNRAYWNTISHLLLQILQDIPPHVHIGVLLAATVPSKGSEEIATTFSCLDLTSPIPHMLQYVQYEAEEDDNNEPHGIDGAENGTETTSGGLLDRMALVPADSLHLPNILAAIRSLVDYDPSQLTTTQQAYTLSMPLGKAIESILDFMDKARHPGQANLKSGNPSKDATSSLEDQILYAGGKIMTFLASCPTDLRGEDWRPLTRKSQPRTTVGLGGFGGAVQRNVPMTNNNGSAANGHHYENDEPVNITSDEEAGYRKSANGDSKAATLDTDMTPESLLDYYRAPEHVEAYLSELGTQCAESALGVDIFVLVQCQDDYAGTFGGVSDDTVELDVGLPFLRGLTDRSGAPGPLIFPLHQGYATPIGSNPDMQRLRREVYARVPWGAYDDDATENDDITGSDGSTGRHQPMAFGGELRLRMSPSFEVDRSPVDEAGEGPQLAPLYSSGGVMGPASEEQGVGNLFRLGTCDPFTALTVDLDMKQKSAKDRLYVDGLGEINWKPVLQTCFAYTAIVKDPEQPGRYLTVRQMRIACMRAPLTDDVETLYSSIDPEVIGTVLFQKLTLTLLQDGLAMAQTIGEDWLKALLVCAYQSAEAEEAIQREQAEKGVPLNSERNDGGDNTTLTFYANERLLDREGELSAEDVLMGQGHELLKPLPLIVYALLHCDAIRPANIESSYFPTMDARSAAGTQMSSMTPPALARCIAPQLQLWSASGGMILDTIDLRMEAVKQAVVEFGYDARTRNPRPDLVLLMDAPDCIVVCDASYISSDPSSNTGKKKKKPIKVGVDLERAIRAAVNSYRTPPTVIYDIDQHNFNGGPGFFRLVASLVEDQQGNRGAANFKEWREKLAGDIHE